MLNTKQSKKYFAIPFTKCFLSLAIFATCVGAAVSVVPGWGQEADKPALTNEDVVKMVKSGLGEGLIVSMVRNQPGKYSMTPDDLVKLKDAGVSEKVLTAMAEKAPASSPNSSGSVKVALKTPVKLIVDESVSSKDEKAGDAFKLVAAEDVVINGHIVIAKGAAGTGRITDVMKRTFATHNGKIEVAVDSVRAVDGLDIALDGRASEGGGGVGFGRTGKDAEFKKGRVINAVVASEREVKF